MMQRKYMQPLSRLDNDMSDHIVIMNADYNKVLGSITITEEVEALLKKGHQFILSPRLAIANEDTINLVDVSLMFVSAERA